MKELAEKFYHNGRLITFKPRENSDEEFLLSLYSSTREEELQFVQWIPEQKNNFLSMQFRAQSEHYRNAYPDMHYSIIFIDGERAGRIITAQLHDEIRLIDVALLSSFRGIGIGTRLMNRVLELAGTLHLPVRLHVEAFNPARHLYERLGFREIWTDNVYIRMEANPIYEMYKIINKPIAIEE